MYVIRSIKECDNMALAAIIRKNLERFHLDIPGTAYFDPELDFLSDFYDASPEKRGYFVVADESGTAFGGVGIAEFPDIKDCAEIQKLYLDDAAKGLGFGRKLMEEAEKQAEKRGYRRLYLETHTNLVAAIALYEKLGFSRIDKPDFVLHGTMNRFYMKELE